MTVLNNNRILFGIITIVIFLPFVGNAQVVVSEIMYNLDGSDSGHEWVEVFNASGASVPLSTWRLFEADTNHKIKSVSGGDNLASGNYAIIADNAATFLADHPGYSGALFDSAFSLNNSGETLTLRDSDLSDMDTVSFSPDTGADGDGNSLHRSAVGSAAFVASAPTLGTGILIGDTSGTGVEDTAQQNDTTTIDTNSVIKASSSNFSVEPQIYAYAGKDRTVIVGADVPIDGLAFNKSGESIDNVRFIWNFGDGVTAGGESILHHWSHPGRYVLVLDIAQQKNAASDSVIITAEPARITLGKLSDGSLVVTNNAGRTLDLSFWHLQMGGRTFTIPEHSLFLNGEDVAFTPEVTGLSIITNAAELLYPNGTVAVKENAAGSTIKAISKTERKNPIIIGQQITEPEAKIALNIEKSVVDIDSITQVDNLAAAGSTQPPVGPWVLGLGIFTGISAATALGLRRYSRNSWKIIEEEGEDV